MPNVPADNALHTLVWREEYADDYYDLSNLNGLTVVNGEAWGGLDNGPTWLGTPGDQGTQRTFSLALKKSTAAEIAGANRWVFEGYRTISKTRAMVSFWVRPSDLSPTAANLLRLYGSSPIDFGIISGKWRYSGATEGTASVNDTIISDQWYQCQIYWQTASTIAFRVWNTEGTLVYSNSTTIGYVLTVTGVGYRLRIPSGQNGFYGRGGPLNLYDVADVTAGTTRVESWLAPTNAQTIYEASPDGSGTTDYQAKTLSGWEAVRLARLRSVILPRYDGWHDLNGNDTGYETLADTAAKEAWWEAWDAGERVATGDVVELATGVYRVTNLTDWSSGRGVTYRAASGASPDIRMSESITGTWSQPNAGTYPRVWKYDGSTRVNRHVWGSAWESFNPYGQSGGTITDAYIALSADPWSCYSPASGITYISLPDGVNPTSLAPFEASGLFSSSVNMAWTGSYLNGLKIQGSATYAATIPANTGNKALANNCISVEHQTNAITVVEDCDSWRGAKHNQAFVTTGRDGLAIFKNLDVSYVPGGDVGSGDFAALVDYSSAVFTSIPSRIFTVYDSITNAFPTEPCNGTSTAIANRVPLYYAHGNTGNGVPIAKTIVKRPNINMFNPSEFDGTPLPGTHLAFEVINPYGSFSPDWATNATQVASMIKNTAGQYVSFQLVSATDGSNVTTGSPTVYLTKDGGTQATGLGTVAHEGNGQWSYACPQADTDADHVAFTIVLANCISQTVNLYPKALPPTATEIASACVNAILATPANKIATNASGYVTATNGGASASAADIADAVLEELTADHSGVPGSLAEAIEKAAIIPTKVLGF